MVRVQCLCCPETCARERERDKEEGGKGKWEGEGERDRDVDGDVGVDKDRDREADKQRDRDGQKQIETDRDRQTAIGSAWARERVRSHTTPRSNGGRPIVACQSNQRRGRARQSARELQHGWHVHRASRPLRAL